VRQNVMRQYFASLVFAGCALAASPALTASPVNETESGSVVAVQPNRLPLGGLRDEAAMVLLGTALIGLGAAVRRAA